MHHIKIVKPNLPLPNSHIVVAFDSCFGLLVPLVLPNRCLIGGSSPTHLQSMMADDTADGSPPWQSGTDYPLPIFGLGWPNGGVEVENTTFITAAIEQSLWWGQCDGMGHYYHYWKSRLIKDHILNLVSQLGFPLPAIVLTMLAELCQQNWQHDFSRTKNKNLPNTKILIFVVSLSLNNKKTHKQVGINHPLIKHLTGTVALWNSAVGVRGFEPSAN